MAILSWFPGTQVPWIGAGAHRQIAQVGNVGESPDVINGDDPDDPYLPLVPFRCQL